MQLGDANFSTKDDVIRFFAHICDEARNGMRKHYEMLMKKEVLVIDHLLQAVHFKILEEITKRKYIIYNDGNRVEIAILKKDYTAIFLPIAQLVADLKEPIVTPLAILQSPSLFEVTRGLLGPQAQHHLLGSGPIQ